MKAPDGRAVTRAVPFRKALPRASGGHGEAGAGGLLRVCGKHTDADGAAWRDPARALKAAATIATAAALSASERANGSFGTALLAPTHPSASLALSILLNIEVYGEEEEQPGRRLRARNRKEGRTTDSTDLTLFLRTFRTAAAEDD